ncbi:major facilitator superfamily domain-containing protein [Plectosphaerella plurivora]|uniref:Major facilitator superfamily domain-containing protein n=1 Tax=Plectosphaerella plurivora TaxID=936078 RepID=A0A9P8V2K4_9PEZI|nr:major facilitator superfamily domain-containing protein [Plectosphaerella plurivora]
MDPSWKPQTPRTLSFSASSLSASSLSFMEPAKNERPPAQDDIAGSVFLISASGELLKLPIPSTSPRDPLAWSKTTRMTAFACLIFLFSVNGVTIRIPALVQPGLHHEFPDNSLNSAVTFFVAMGYIMAIPTSIAVGRRPVILFSCLIQALTVLWAGIAGNYFQLLAAVVFQSVTAGGILGVTLLIVMDATFIHERPMAFTLVWSAGGFLPAIAFLPFPYIMDPRTQWRPMFYIWSPPVLIAGILALLFIPETYFVRPAVAFDGRVLVQSSSEKVQIYDDWESMPCGPRCPHRNHVHDEEPGKSTWINRLKIRRAPGTSVKGGLATYVQMLLCLTNPLLVWVSLLSAAILSGVIFMDLTLPDYLGSTLPESEGEDISIYLGVAILIGCLLAIPSTGPFITWCTKYFTLRGGGTRHAEYFLPGFALPVITSALSVGLFGLATANKMPPGMFYFAFGLSTFAYVSNNITVILWITEAFPPWAAASLGVQMFVGNMVAFSVGFNLLAWVKADEALLCNIIIVSLVLFLGAFAVPIAFWGKTVRQYITGKWSESEKGAIRPV